MISTDVALVALPDSGGTGRKQIDIVAMRNHFGTTTMRDVTCCTYPGGTNRSLGRLSLIMMSLILSSLGLTCITGCGLIPEKVSYHDRRVQQLLKAANHASECRFAFTPVTADSDIRLEKSSGRYDLMLHVDGATSRTIAFRKDDDKIKWIGEQEIYTGPKQYKTVDGIFFEQICVTYDIETVSGYEVDRLHVTYSGEDPRLADKDSLDLETVLPVLHEWGYDVELIGAPMEGLLIHLGPTHPVLADGSGSAMLPRLLINGCANAGFVTMTGI